MTSVLMAGTNDFRIGTSVLLISDYLLWTLAPEECTSPGSGLAVDISKSVT